ncbi:hypothetical protein DFH09DRAFT_1278663 [Mycena vulgaris]|nr:hypothetical protein DFH09DRAFT_1278663 [Mycena vulgaris]
MPPKPSNAATKAVATMPALRPKRAKQPGGPDMPRTKRTSEQVQQAKQAKDDEKQEAEEKRRQGLATPPQSRIESTGRTKCAMNTPITLRPQSSRRSCVLALKSPRRTKMQEVTPAPVDPFSDGPGSSDDFKLDAQAPDPSDDELMDASDDEGVKPAKPGRPKKPGKGSLRQAVNEERVRLGGSVAEGKRKPSKKAKRAVGGIRVDWTRGRTPAVIPSLHGPSRSRSTGSAMSFISHQRDASSEADFDPPDSDSSVIGGILSDVDDGEERSFADALPEKAKVARTKVTSIAGIVETDAPGLVALRKRSSGKIKKATITLSDLPEDVRGKFKSAFTPPLLEYVGCLEAWTDPTADQVVAIWNGVFPRYALDVDNRADDHLVLVIVKLAQGKIDNWRHKFAVAAIASVNFLFAAQEKTGDVAQIAQDVEFYLEGTDRSRVFYYREYAEDDAGKATYKGIFQSYLYSRVFAVHCLATAVDGELGPLGFDPALPSTRPIGAITLGTQAIKRTLNYYKTGELVIPSGTLGNFSKTNWGDHFDFAEGVKTSVHSTSGLTALVTKLEAKQWKKIIAAAQEASTARDEAPADGLINVDADPVDNDFDVIDDDSD